MVKKIVPLTTLTPQELIHHPFYGERIKRRDDISVSIKTTSKWMPVELWRYSPFGIEVVSNVNFNPKQGENISVKINLAGYETKFDNLTITSLHKEDDVGLVGIRTHIQDKEVKQPTHKWWACAEEFLPKGVVQNPVREREYFGFKVKDISIDGLKLIISMRDRLFCVGQKLEARITLPYNIGFPSVRLQIERISFATIEEKKGDYTTNEDCTILDTRFTKKDPMFLLKPLGEYLLNFSEGATLEKLNNDGFGLKPLSKWLDFEFDPQAKKLTAKVDGKVVGSVDVCLEKRDGLAFSNMYIDDDLEKTDIVYQFVAHLVLLTLKAERRYLHILSPWSKFIDTFEKCGAKKAERKNDLLIDANSVIFGKGITPKYWDLLYSNALSYFEALAETYPRPSERFKMEFYEVINSLRIKKQPPIVIKRQLQPLVKQ